MLSLIAKKHLTPFSFLKFSQTLSKIQQIPSINQKVQILSQYILTLNNQQKLFNIVFLGKNNITELPFNFQAFLNIYITYFLKYPFFCIGIINQRQIFIQTKKLFDLVNQKTKTGVSDKLLINKCTKIFTGNQLDADNNGEDSQKNNSQKNKETVSIVEQYIPTDKISLNVQVQQINQSIQKIIQIQGKGSIELKIKQIIDTLAKLSFIQSRFFLRILTKDIKIGMKNKLIQKAYNESQTTQTGSNIALNFKSFNAMLARPLRDVEEFQKFCSKKQGQIVADVKYDGQRTLITYEKGKQIVLISRNGKQQNQKYYKITEKLQKILQNQPNLQRVTLDAQILCIDKFSKEPLPFQVLLTKRRKVDSILPLDQTQDVEQVVYVFDVLQYNGQKLYETSLIDRKKLIFENDLIKKGQFEVFKYPEQSDKLMEYYHTIIQRKYEGLILKGPEDHYYTNGTRIHWGKLKKGFREKKQDKGLIDLDLILMGADYGRGKKSNFFSSFLMGVKKGTDIVPISRVGTGFSDDDLEQLTQEFSVKIEKTIDSRYKIPKNIRMDVWFKPELVIEVDCQQFTRSPLYELGYKENYGGISLRFPVFKRLRDDKNIDQATQAQNVLEEMEKQEKKSIERSEKKLAFMKLELNEQKKVLL